MYGQTDEMTAHERFARAFEARRHVFVVAIHVTPTPKEWQKDIDVARDADADGIIVIRDYATLATDDDTMAAYDYARRRYMHWWIGINLLDHKPSEAVLRARHSTSGIWFDNVRVGDGKSMRLKSESFHLPTPPLLIVSVAMKYLRPDEGVAAAAKLVEPFSDVIVTSGNKTGEPPSIEKVNALCSAVNIPTGICSGTDESNVEMFVDLGVNMFIVNTNISTNGRLDLRKALRLRYRIPKTTYPA